MYMHVRMALYRVKIKIKRYFINRLPFVKQIANRWKTSSNLRSNRTKENRKLEIGPGEKRIPGFETLNIIDGPQVDYIWDATKTLPFQDNTFDVVFASHIFEHIPWYQSEDVIKEWSRILKPNGWIEIWVPDGVKICKAFVDSELFDDNYIDKDGWYKFNLEKDPCLWASGRIFTYGDGTGNPSHPNWHRAVFSRRFLFLLFHRAGLYEIQEMNLNQVRGDDHGWINLGVRGKK